MSKIDLLIRLPNWVGDVLMAYPSLRALQIEGFRVRLLGKSWIHDLLAGTQFEQVTLPISFISKVSLCRSFPEKRALLFTNSLSNVLMMQFSGKSAIGYRRNISGLFLTDSLSKTKPQHEVVHFGISLNSQSIIFFQTISGQQN